MKNAKDIAPFVASLVLVLMVGQSGSGYCQDGSSSGARAKLATAPGWVTTGSLNMARQGHTATLLPNGKVLVVGGDLWNSPQILDSAELYDPANGTWSVTGRLSGVRTGHTATLLPSGRVLVAGGEGWENGFAYFNTADLYDPGKGTWSPTGNMSASRTGHTATLLQSGKVLVVGGYYNDQIVAFGELYDPATGTWSRTGNNITPRVAHTATLLQDGRVLLVRGTNDITDFAFSFAAAELYDPGTGTWSRTTSLTTPRYAHTATLLPNGKVLVTGGFAGVYQNGPASLASSVLYDPRTGTWGDLRALTTARDSHTATLLPNGNVLLAGGFDRDAHVDVNVTEMYDANSGQWNATGNLNTARSGHTATLMPNGRVLVAGGIANVLTNGDSHSVLASAELFGSVASPVSIGPGFTGAWFDPVQSGHGLFIEVLNDNRFLAWWFTFNPPGTEQAWFGGVGTYSGNTATISDVYRTTGGRFVPNFDPSRIANNRWGTLTFTFTDCNHGRVDFSSVAGYSSGNMNLTRLTQLAGLVCP